MIGFRALRRAGGTAALLLAMARTTSAAPITDVAVDGTWFVLNDFMTAGQYFTGTGAVFPSFPAAGAGVSAIDDARRYRWTSANSVRLDLTDWSVAGDGFRIWVDSFNPAVPLATYTVPAWYLVPGCDSTVQSDGTGTGCPYTFDLDAAFADANFAHGSLVFGPGTYELVIQGYLIPDYYNGNTQTITGPFPDATVALRLTEVPIPEPASLLLLGSGLLGGAMRLRKKRQPGVKA